MFAGLLLTLLLISIIIAYIVTKIFYKPVSSILKKIIDEDIYTAWVKYIIFAIYVVGIAGGVRVWNLEKYIMKTQKYTEIVELSTDKWMLELYGGITGALGSITWMLLVFFLCALVVYVVKNTWGLKKDK
ncbi:MAG: hypothetical protein JW871_08920 [Endomicrobiales bacterium]|nr:hypothetical protein [Endomicrobiales bacterium]